MKGNLLVVNVGQLLTLAALDGPKRGLALWDLGLVEGGAILIREGFVAWVGLTAQAEALAGSGIERIDTGGRVVLPGFVDPHTHLVWGGDRIDEFEQRVGGATYQEIAAAGGGIVSTVRATQAASQGELLDAAERRLDVMLAHGTTTAEAKSGYGLDVSGELKCLEVVRLLGKRHPVALVSTFLGAHAVPVAYRGQPDEYIDRVVVDEMMPRVVRDERSLPRDETGEVQMESTANIHAPLVEFCDVFCDAGAFDLAQSRRVLEAAKDQGLGLKIHADEFEPLGGARLAVELGAASADHLVVTPPADIAALANSDTVAVLLPGTPFGLATGHYADARAFIEAGAAVALATDLNPGTSPCPSMPFIIALACRYMKMTPAEAVAAATINAAHAIRRGDVVGSLEVGKQGDLLILDTDDYRDLAYQFGGNLVQTVVKTGRVVKGG